MTGKDPAEHDPDIFLTKRIGGQAYSRRHCGDPIQAIKYRKCGKTPLRSSQGIRQPEKRHSAQPVIATEQIAAVVPVREPSRKSRSEEIEYPHEGQETGRSNFRDAVVNTRRDKMGADKTVCAGSADKKTSREQPEIPGL